MANDGWAIQQPNTENPQNNQFDESVPSGMSLDEKQFACLALCL